MSEIPAELLEQMTPAVRMFVEMLLARIAQHNRQLVQLRAKMVQLEAKLNKTSRNSSKPPSTGHPHARPLPKTTKSRKKRGGQPGHDRFERTLIPAQQCQSVMTCKPEVCRGCGESLSGKDSSPLRQEVWDVQIKPVVTEYQQHRLICPCCEMVTCGALPEEVDGRTGPVLAGLLVLLRSWFRTSRRRAALFSRNVCGVPCSPGHVKCRDGTLTHAELQDRLSPVKVQVNSLLLRGLGTAAHGMCKQLSDHKEHLWTFLENPDVAPTNNAAERSLRHGVMWRKRTSGTRSARGDRFVEVMLSVIETCRQQERSVLTYVTTALKTKTPASLLPTNLSNP